MTVLLTLPLTVIILSILIFNAFKTKPKDPVIFNSKISDIASLLKPQIKH